jgi:cation diffusion facilitator family transporter
MDPQPIQAVALGLTVSVIATVVNLWVARLPGRAGERFGSIALEADAQHLMTDVWTSIGVVAGVAGVALTGWQWLDAVIALIVAANIVRIGFVLLRRSMLGLLDTALPEELRVNILGVLERHQRQGVEFHALRSRQAGVRRFVSLHILVPGDWTVQRGHDLLEQIEEEIRIEVPKVTVFTHLEPLEDPASWEDTQLERPDDMPMQPRSDDHPPAPPALH